MDEKNFGKAMRWHQQRSVTRVAPDESSLTPLPEHTPGKLAVSHEKKMGISFFTALEGIHDNMIETIITILWGAMQPLNANFPFEKASKLFDDYIDEGHSIEDLTLELNALFEASGFFRKGQE